MILIFSIFLILFSFKVKLFKTNFDLKMNANKKFEDEINIYSYNWSEGGQFSKKRYNEQK